MKTKYSPLTDLALRAIHDLKALEVKVLDVRAQTPMTDDMIVCTGTSTRHVRSIAENVVKEAKRAGHQPQGVEGLSGSEWVLVDLGGVVVHVMQVQTRVFYQLEKLWEMAPPAVVAAARPAAKKKKAGAGKKAVAGKKATRRPAGKSGRKPVRPAARKSGKGKPKRRA